MPETNSQQIIRDIARLRETEANLEALLKILPVGVSILGKDRKPIFTNLALERILGLSDAQLQAGKYARRKYLRVDGSQMPDDEFPSIRAFEEGQVIENVEIGIVKEDGELIWAMVSAVPFDRGEWRVVLTVADVTAQKNAEVALQKRTVELGERVKELRCLYGISALVEQPEISLEEIFQGTVDLMPASWQYPAETCARIIFDGRVYVSPGFQTSRQQQRYDIYVHAQKRGMIDVFFLGTPQGKPFLQEEHDLLHAIAERLGRIAERFHAEQLLLTLAATDPLTGLHNRRHFFELAEQEVARAKRYGHPLACIMVDVDDFKGINDSNGHLFGDKVLRSIVRSCQTTIREVDIFARYGGDEFVILLPESDLNNGSQMAERLCVEFRHQSLKIDKREITITLSLGVASMPGNGDLALDILLNRADVALYEAKGKGRNQVFAWDETQLVFIS